MQKLSILQFINVRWLNAEAGYAIALSKKLAQKGHKVFVCGVKGTPPVVQAEKLGIPTLTSLKLHHNNPYHLWKDYNTLIDFIKKENIQIINTHRSEGHFLGALAKKFYNNNLVLIRTRGDVRLPKNYFINEWLYNFTDKIITSAQIMEKMYFTNLNVPHEKIITIYNSVDTDKFNPEISGNNTRKNLGIKNDEILIGIVGRLSPVKGHKYFIDAAAQVISRLPESTKVKFLISGKESQVKFADLKSQAEKLGIINSFVFLGVQNEVTELMAAIDIGIVASLGSETNCRVTQEFMSMAKPVIGTQVGVIPEVLINNKCGIIVPSHDSTSLANAILELVTNSDKAKKFGQNARELMAKEFNEDIFVERTEKIYFELL